MHARRPLDASVCAYPFGELCVHHEVMHVLLRLCQLKLPGYHGNNQCGASCSLCERDEEQKTEGQGEKTTGTSEITHTHR